MLLPWHIKQIQTIFSHILKYYLVVSNDGTVKLTGNGFRNMSHNAWMDSVLVPETFPLCNCYVISTSPQDKLNYSALRHVFNASVTLFCQTNTYIVSH
jgi:hypothetical protein